MNRTSAPQGIDPDALGAWLHRHLPGSPGPHRYTLIAGGHSNLTYRMEDAGGHAFVLRRPPLGPIAPGAHDVAREYRILAALQGTPVPVPPVEALCVDPAVTGAPFYLMRWVEGRIVDRPGQVEEYLPDVALRRRTAFNLVDVLAAIHQVDVDRIGLGDLGARDGYLPRQLERMQRAWLKTRTRELPLMDSLHARLTANIPPQRYTGLVHSDYRLGNVMIGTGGQLAAVLDWELCALGDVLVDLAFLLSNWDAPDDPWPNVWMAVPPTRAGGFPTRVEMTARYVQRTGFEVAELDYYRAFCYWRNAVIAEGVKRRYLAGAMAEQGADPILLEQRVRDRAVLADRFLTAAGR